MARMSLTANRPLNWNVFTIDSKEKARYANQLRASERAAERGAGRRADDADAGRHDDELPDLFPDPSTARLEVDLALPLPERMASCTKPDVRAKMLAGARSPEAGVFARVADFANFKIGQTFSSANHGLTGRFVKDVAKRRGKADFDVLLDVVLADELKTVLWPEPPDGDAESWQMRKAAWESPHCLLGGSDAGASRPDVRCARRISSPTACAGRSSGPSRRRSRRSRTPRHGSSASGTVDASRRACTPISCSSIRRRSVRRKSTSGAICPAGPRVSMRNRRASCASSSGGEAIVRDGKPRPTRVRGR